MREVVFAKFTQHKDIQKALLETGDAILIEHTTNDYYWGDGGNGSGKNKLGLTLMSVREELRQNSKSNVNNTPTEEQIKAAMKEDGEDGEDGEEEEEELAESKDENVKASEDQEEDEEEEENEENDEEGGYQMNPMNQRGPITINEAPIKIGGRGLIPVSKKRAKARRQRNVFLDVDGNARMEKNNDEKGTVNLVGTGDNKVKFSEKALPASAKVVLYRNQFRRKYQPTEADFPENEEEENTTPQQQRHKTQLLDFLPETTKVQESEITEETPDYLLSPSLCIETSKNTLEFIKQLPKDDPATVDLMKKCKELKPVLEEFISLAQSEDIMSQLLVEYENVSKVLEESK